MPVKSDTVMRITSVWGGASLTPFIFVGTTKAAIKRFPIEARRVAGWQLQAAQEGIDSDDWEPMLSIAKGVKEIGIYRQREHRIVYIAQFPEAVYIFGAFEKKTEETAPKYLNAARLTYAEIKRKRNAKLDELVFEQSSGNIFEDLGFPVDDAVSMLIRGQFAIEIVKIIESEGWSQKEAGRRINVTQARIDAMLKMKIHHFSIDALIKCLGKLNRRVLLVVEHPPDEVS